MAHWPIVVVVRFKAQVCGSLIRGIVGEDMDVRLFVFVMCCLGSATLETSIMRQPRTQECSCSTQIKDTQHNNAFNDKTIISNDKNKKYKIFKEDITTV